MASSADGAILDFSSRLALKQEPLALNGNRIYRHGETTELRVSKIESVEIGYPLLSANAQTYGTYTYTLCSGFCSIAQPSHRMHPTRNGVSTILYGNQLRLSRNGRFAFNSGFPSLSPAPNMRDLDTGTVHNFPSVLSRHTRNAISDEGTIVTTEAGKLAGIGDPNDYEQVLLTPFGKPLQLIFKGRNVHFAAITPQGKSVFLVHESSPDFYRLLEIQPESGSQSLLWEGTAQPLNIQPSHDGQRLLMQRKDQLLLWERQTGWKSLAYLEEGFSESLLSDNGSVVFAISQSNRYLRIDNNTNESTQLYAPFPSYLSQRSFGAYPGSLIQFSTGYSEPSLVLRLGDFVLPIVKSEGKILDVQIPWEATPLTGRQSIAELSSPESPFVLRESVFIESTPRPWIFSDSNASFGNLIIAAQEDFASLVTLAHPAPPGSTIHFWVTGLGPLDQSLATGQKDPSNPVSRPIAQLSCGISIRDDLGLFVDLGQPLVIYAPNLVGVYQVDITIPRFTASGLRSIKCALGFNESLARIPVGPPAN